MTESFIRQRRNLFVINGILLFSFLAKVNISKLSIVGISFEGFQRPEVTYLFLWSVWGYFFYRFIVYFVEDEKQSFLEMWKREIERFVNSALMKIAISKSESKYRGACAGYYSLKRNSWNLNYQESYEDEIHGEQLQNARVRVLPKEIFAPWLKGAVRFIFLTPAVTNYILPLLFSLAVLYIAGFAAWEGALFDTFSTHAEILKPQT